METKLTQVKHRLYQQRESLLHEIEMGDKGTEDGTEDMEKKLERIQERVQERIQLERIQALDQLKNEMTAKINGVDNKFSNLDVTRCESSWTRVYVDYDSTIKFQKEGFKIGINVSKN